MFASPPKAKRRAHHWTNRQRRYWISIPRRLSSERWHLAHRNDQSSKKICEQLETGDTLVVCKLDRFCRTAKEGLGYVDYLRGKGVAVHILNMGVIDNSPMGRLMVTMLLAFAEFERSLIIERTQTGKAAARSRTGFRDGRPPKFSREQIDHAICLLENHSYKEVTKMTGISRSTLQRENRKRRNQ